MVGMCEGLPAGESGRGMDWASGTPERVMRVGLLARMPCEWTVLYSAWSHNRVRLRQHPLVIELGGLLIDVVLASASSAIIGAVLI